MLEHDVSVRLACPRSAGTRLCEFCLKTRAHHNAELSEAERRDRNRAKRNGAEPERSGTERDRSGAARNGTGAEPSEAEQNVASGAERSEAGAEPRGPTCAARRARCDRSAEASRQRCRSVDLAHRVRRIDLRRGGDLPPPGPSRRFSFQAAVPISRPRHRSALPALDGSRSSPFLRQPQRSVNAGTGHGGKASLRPLRRKAPRGRPPSGRRD